MGEITLTKKVNTSRNKDLICQYPDCGMEFNGFPNSKYCPFHQIPSNREYIQYVVKYEKTTKQVTNITKISNASFTCDCCGVEFDVILYPYQSEYPRFCELHRNKYKRDQYLIQNNRENEIFTETKINKREARKPDIEKILNQE